MGLPKFVGVWMRNKKFYSLVISKSLPINISSIEIDMNSFIYKTANIVYALPPDDIKKLNVQKRKIMESRQEYIKNLSPEVLEYQHFEAIGTEIANTIDALAFPLLETDLQDKSMILDTFVIAIDGVAPQAKMKQQRSRRWRKTKVSKVTVPFTTISITPGTSFMIRLDSYLKQWFVTNRKSLGKRLIYSSHLSPGEGEHKIMDYLRNGYITGDGNHIIHGMDTDLIMLSLLSDQKNLYLWRPDANVIMNIDLLRHEINKYLSTNENEDNSMKYRDFVTMMMFLENDFLPYQPTLDDYGTSIDIMIDNYKKLNLPITDNNGIIWSNMAKWIELMAGSEKDLLNTESKRIFKYPSRVFRASTTTTSTSTGILPGQMYFNYEKNTIFDIDAYRSAWYSYALGPRGNTSVIDKILSLTNTPPKQFDVSTDKIVKMASNYLTGIAWIYSYYTKGINSINTRWYYPYYHTPMLSDLSLVLNAIIDENKQIIGWQSTGEPMQSVFNQLLSVIPLNVNYLLPQEIQYLTDVSSPIADLFPRNFAIDLSGMNEDYRGIVLIPNVNPYRVDDSLDLNVFTPQQLQLYTETKDILDDVSPIELTHIVCTRPDAFNRYDSRGRGRGRSGYIGTRGASRGRGSYRGGDKGASRGRGSYRGGDRGGYRNRSMDTRESTRGGYIQSYTSDSRSFTIQQPILQMPQ